MGAKARRFLDPDSYEDRVRWMPCVVCLKFGTRHRAEVAHVKSRGAGGGIAGNVVPLCRFHHIAQHQQGIQSFQEEYGIDLAHEAEIVQQQVGRS